MFNILIVEDDITFSLMLKTWLGKKGFQVETAASVADAKKKLDGDFPFQVILSDLRLPDQDGIDLLRWLKDERKQVVVIMIRQLFNACYRLQSFKIFYQKYNNQYCAHCRNSCSYALYYLLQDSPPVYFLMMPESSFPDFYVRVYT